MKTVGLALLMATLAPASFAAGYREVWNPPETRATETSKFSAPHKLVAHRHVVPRAMKVHVGRATPSVPKLVAKQNNMQKTAPTAKPDMSEIPRQLTPEGNVLRVHSRGAAAEVTR